MTKKQTTLIDNDLKNFENFLKKLSEKETKKIINKVDKYYFNN